MAARLTEEPRPVANGAAPEAPPEKIHGVSRHASVVTRLRAALKFYQGELGQCPLSDAELGREIHAQRHEVSGSLAHLRNYGEINTIVRTIDDTDPRVSGRELRAARRGLVYVERSPSRRRDGEFEKGDRTELDRIASVLEGKVSAAASKFRAAVETARKDRDDAVAVAHAEATIARINLRRSTPTPDAARTAS